MIERLEIHHLKALAALYQFGNISPAAESLGVSQQAISLKLKTIRDILGDPLFVRTGHGMAPTPYAKLIEPFIYKALTAFNEIPRSDAIDPKKLERTLTISATDYTQEIIIAPLLEKLRKFAPKTNAIVTNIEAANLISKVHQGEIDVVFTSHGYLPAGLISEPLFTEKYLCVTSNKSLSLEQMVTLEQLIQHDFVITSPGVGSFIGSADDWFQRQGCHRNVVLSVPSFHIAKQALRHSDMAGFIPSRLLPCEGLFEIPLNKYPPGFEVVMAYHPSSSLDPLITWLRHTLSTDLSDN
ncbi:LysR family transcriptional regulator [Gynuella sp.]|uniref:LysR family transcriptional regulator n=1 Tax=Gynuella sp. TaxID=2969146 RepID=UPI003D0AAFCA